MWLQIPCGGWRARPPLPSTVRVACLTNGPVRQNDPLTQLEAFAISPLASSKGSVTRCSEGNHFDLGVGG